MNRSIIWIELKIKDRERERHPGFLGISLSAIAEEEVLMAIDSLSRQIVGPGCHLMPYVTRQTLQFFLLSTYILME